MRNTKIVIYILLLSILVMTIVWLYKKSATKNQVISLKETTGEDCYIKIVNGKVICLDDIIMDQADAETFVCLKNGFSKDKYHVFRSWEIFSKYADPSSFEVLEYLYCKDKYHVFQCPDGTIIEGADPNSFVPFDISISKDKYNVYFLSGRSFRRIPEADAASFEPIKDHDPYFRDKKYLYLFQEIIGSIDSIDLDHYFNPYPGL